MPSMILLNLPVRDLAASTAFHMAVGGTVNPRFSGENSTLLMFADTIGVMLLIHDHCREFTKRETHDAIVTLCSPLRFMTMTPSMRR